MNSIKRERCSPKGGVPAVSLALPYPDFCVTIILYSIIRKMRRVDCGVKKFRKLTIGGIESKVFNLILLTGVLISLAFIAVIGYQSRMLAALKVETSTRQQESISQITDAVMDQVVQENIARITQLQATETDEVFQRLELRVRLVAAYVEKLFAEPENYAPAPYAPPRAELDGTLSVQATYAAGVDPDDPAVKARMGLVANASDLMLSLLNAYETDNICIGLEEGAMLSVNSLSGGWVWEDGTPVRFDPRGRYWYKAARDAGELTFTDVEIDRATGDLCVTCTQPIYGPGGELAAVVSGDLFLDQMQQIVRDSAADGGFLAVINQSGHVILSPEEEGIFQVQQSSYDQDLIFVPIDKARELFDYDTEATQIELCCGRAMWRSRGRPRPFTGTRAPPPSRRSS